MFEAKSREPDVHEAKAESLAATEPPQPNRNAQSEQRMKRRHVSVAWSKRVWHSGLLFYVGRGPLRMAFAISR
jgi:hypothetical protein